MTTRICDVCSRRLKLYQAVAVCRKCYIYAPICKRCFDKLPVRYLCSMCETPELFTVR